MCQRLNTGESYNFYLGIFIGRGYSPCSGVDWVSRSAIRPAAGGTIEAVVLYAPQRDGSTNSSTGGGVQDKSVAGPWQKPSLSRGGGHSHFTGGCFDFHARRTL